MSTSLLSLAHLDAAVLTAVGSLGASFILSVFQLGLRLAARGRRP